MSPRVQLPLVCSLPRRWECSLVTPRQQTNHVPARQNAGNVTSVVSRPTNRPVLASMILSLMTWRDDWTQPVWKRSVQDDRTCLLPLTAESFYGIAINFVLCTWSQQRVASCCTQARWLRKSYCYTRCFIHSGDATYSTDSCTCWRAYLRMGFKHIAHEMITAVDRFYTAVRVIIKQALASLQACEESACLVPLSSRFKLAHICFQQL